MECHFLADVRSAPKATKCRVAENDEFGHPRTLAVDSFSPMKRERPNLGCDFQ